MVNGLAPGDPAKMATKIIESVDFPKAPMRMVLGSQALQATITRLKERISDRKERSLHEKILLLICLCVFFTGCGNPGRLY